MNFNRNHDYLTPVSKLSPVLSRSRRRLSLVQNDDFAFNAHRRNEAQADISKRRLSLIQIDDLVFCNSVFLKDAQFDNSIINEEEVSDNVKTDNVTSTESSDSQVDSVVEESRQNAIIDVSYDPIWKYTTNNSIMRYTFMRKLRKKVMLDLERHFEREVMHDRLFSCLRKFILLCSNNIYLVYILCNRNIFSSICYDFSIFPKHSL